MAVHEGTILTDSKLIESELHGFHIRSRKENCSVPPGVFRPVTWDHPFSESDSVLKLTNDMVVGCIRRLKNSAVPDNVSPKVTKLLFGSDDLVNPLGELLRAVIRTRIFPSGGKLAKQIFCWKGVGVRNNLEKLLRWLILFWNWLNLVLRTLLRWCGIELGFQDLTGTLFWCSGDQISLD